MQDTDAWSLYWQNNHQESCITPCNETDSTILIDIWQNFALDLKPNFELLDLATGNGSVARRLISFNKHLKVTAVDQASIDPTKYVDDNILLDNIQFVADVNIEKLPFEQNIFDAVTSQFGLEYSNLSLSIPELVRVLKQAGRFLFIMHHADSEVVGPAKLKVKEFNLIFESNLLHDFELFLSNNLSLEELNKTGEKLLNNPELIKSNAITGQIFSAIDKLIVLKNQNKKQNAEVLLNTLQNMTNRIVAENSRLEQLISSSLTQIEIEALCNSLKNEGAKATFKSITLSDNQSVIGWEIKGYKL